MVRKLFNKLILQNLMTTEKLKDYNRVCDRCGESFRTTSKSSRICYKCSKYKFKSAALPDEDKDKDE